LYNKNAVDSLKEDSKKEKVGAAFVDELLFDIDDEENITREELFNKPKEDS